MRVSIRGFLAITSRNATMSPIISKSRKFDDLWFLIFNFKILISSHTGHFSNL